MHRATREAAWSGQCMLFAAAIFLAAEADMSNRADEMVTACLKDDYARRRIHAGRRSI